MICGVTTKGSSSTCYPKEEQQGTTTTQKWWWFQKQQLQAYSGKEQVLLAKAPLEQSFDSTSPDDASMLGKMVDMEDDHHADDLSLVLHISMESGNSGDVRSMLLPATSNNNDNSRSMLLPEQKS